MKQPIKICGGIAFIFSKFTQFAPKPLFAPVLHWYDLLTTQAISFIATHEGASSQFSYYRLISVTITEDDMQKSPFTKILSYVVKAQHGLSVTHSTKHRNGLKHSWKIQLRFFVDTFEIEQARPKANNFPHSPSQNTRTEAFLLTFFVQKLWRPCNTSFHYEQKLFEKVVCDCVWSTKLVNVRSINFKEQKQLQRDGLQRAVKEIKPVGWWGFCGEMFCFHV